MTRLSYLAAAGVVFLLEVAIALFAPGGSFLRGSVGDILVIVLLYCLVRGMTRFGPAPCAIGCVAFGFLIEGLQYFHLADLLGLRRDSVLSIAIGNTFSVDDLLMYLIGGIVAFGLDRYVMTLGSMGRQAR